MTEYSASVMQRIRKGLMEVKSSDNVNLGTVTEIWPGSDHESATDPWDDQSCSQLEVWYHGHIHRRLYIPCGWIAQVSGNCVSLKVDARTAETMGWSIRPDWIMDDGRSFPRDLRSYVIVG